MFRYVVLGLLRDGAPRHGYAVAKEYRKRSGLRINTGNFYRELQRLAAEGLVRPATNPPDADVRRAPYEITTLGKTTFDEWLASARDAWLPGYEDGLTSRALFLGDAEPEVLRTVFDGWGEAIWSLVKALERERESVRLQGRDRTDGSFSPLSLLLARRLRHLAVELEFLDEYRAAHAEWIGSRVAGATSAGPPSERNPERAARAARPVGAAAAPFVERGSRERKPDLRSSAKVTR